MINTDEKQEPNDPPLSILQRLDRLDRLLVFLEEKHCLSARDSAAAAVDQCKSLSSALEDVHHKGTLMERVSQLENRVIQLSLHMDVGNTSRSSSFTAAVAVAEKLGHGQNEEDLNRITTLQEKQDLVTEDKSNTVAEACSLNSACCRTPRRRRKSLSKMGYNRKWLKWLQLGC